MEISYSTIGPRDLNALGSHDRTAPLRYRPDLELSVRDLAPQILISWIDVVTPLIWETNRACLEKGCQFRRCDAR